MEFLSGMLPARVASAWGAASGEKSVEKGMVRRFFSQ